MDAGGCCYSAHTATTPTTSRTSATTRQNDKVTRRSPSKRIISAEKVSCISTGAELLLLPTTLVPAATRAIVATVRCMTTTAPLSTTKNFRLLQTKMAPLLRCRPRSCRVPRHCYHGLRGGCMRHSAPSRLLSRRVLPSSQARQARNAEATLTPARAAAGRHSNRQRCLQQAVNSPHPLPHH